LVYLPFGPCSGNLYNNIGDHIRGFVTAVGRVAQVAIDLARFQHLDHVLDVLCAAEQVSQSLAINLFHPVLERLGALGMVVGYARMILQAIDSH